MILTPIHRAVPCHLSSTTFITTITSLLDSLTTPSHLYQIHSQLITTGALLSNPIFPTKIFHICSAVDPPLLTHAHQLFDQLTHPNIFHYNAVIRLHSRHKLPQKCLGFYSKMRSFYVSPDGFTFPCILKACGDLGSRGIKMGKEIHGHVFRFGFARDMFVQNGVVSMYGKCGAVKWARLVFDGLVERNVVSWTAMMSGYVQNGFPVEAVEVFQRMRGEGVVPDFVAIVSVLKGYMDVGGLEQGRSVHGYVIRVGLEMEVDLCITLTAMYAKCRQVLAAQLLFDHVVSAPVMLWNTMISGYAKNGYTSEAVELFKAMVARGLRPDSITIRSVILACSNVGSLKIAKSLEDYILNCEFKDDLFVNTALIDMYSKCGSMESARMVFDHMADKDMVAWSAIIVGYGLNGCGQEAINLFNEMKLSGVRPNDVTFLGLLLACSHAGLVEEGWSYFRGMREYGIEPRQQHYACMVDLLSRAGLVEDAYEFILMMPVEPTISVWGALLNACRIYGNVDLGAKVSERIFALDPENAGHYVQLSNIYATSGMWSDAANVRDVMKGKGVMKSIGRSSIEIDGKRQTYRVGDKSNQNP